MGTYYNPPEELRSVGRELEPGPFDELTAQLKEDELLFGLYDRGIYKYAVYLYSPAEMGEFEGHVQSGILKRIGYFAVPKKAAQAVCGHLWDQVR